MYKNIFSLFFVLYSCKKTTIYHYIEPDYLYKTNKRGKHPRGTIPMQGTVTATLHEAHTEHLASICPAKQFIATAEAIGLILQKLQGRKHVQWFFPRCWFPVHCGSFQPRLPLNIILGAGGEGGGINLPSKIRIGCQIDYSSVSIHS